MNEIEISLSKVITLMLGFMISIIFLLSITDNMELSSIPLIGIVLTIALYIIYKINKTPQQTFQKVDEK